MSLSYLVEVLPKVVQSKLSLWGLAKPPMPLVVTYSITNKCQSRCKTCEVWNIYVKDPKLIKKELTLEQVEKIFKGMEHVYFFNISGGEPFLRPDIADIVDLACKYLSPTVIHTPTNALMPEIIEKQTEKIMETINKHNPKTIFTIKPSFDGAGKEHDRVRGIKGNYDKLLDTVQRLKKLQKKYKNLEVGLGTVISKRNLKNLPETVAAAESLNVDSYINEIAEQRHELKNTKYNITPSADEYENAIKFFSEKIRKSFKTDKNLTKLTRSFRLVYYDLVSQILRKNTQVIPCYGGVTNAHINPYGDIWPCCILAYTKNMGNLVEHDYDFRKVWYSMQSKKVRKYIQDKNCACPLANQMYSNILCDVKSMFKVFKNYISLK